VVRVDLFFVAEGNRCKGKNSFARLIHRLDRFLEPCGRGSNSEFAGRVNYDSASSDCRSEDTGNEGRLLGSLLADMNGIRVRCGPRDVSTDDNVIATAFEIEPGIKPNGDIV